MNGDRFYEALFMQAIGVGLVVLDDRARLVRWNEAAYRRLGYTEEEFLELGIPGIDLAEDEDAYAAHVAAILERGNDTFETRHLCRDGSVMEVVVAAHAVRVNGGRFVQSVWLDVTAERKHQKALQEQRQEALEMAYSLAHDVGAPVRRVKRAVGRLADRDVRAEIEEACEQVDLLAEDLREYARVGRHVGDHRPLPLGDIVAQVVGSMHDDFERYAAIIDFDVLPAVVGDRAGLTRLFSNLFHNALIYNTSGTPSIHVGAVLHAPGWLRVDVTDNGIGISQRFHEEIFKPGRRLWAWHEHPGSGLGLSICRRVAEQHGGCIWLDSRPGHGSTFHVTLPVAEGGDG